MNLDERHILLVEDNPNDEILTIRSLKKNNISNKVIVMRDGEEALSYLLDVEDKNGKHQYKNPLPQVVLLDLNLPKVDGREVLRRIRDHGRTECLPVVVLTSSKEECDLIECYRSGVNSYVQKPVDFNDFSSATQQLGLYWLLLNKTPSFNRYSDFSESTNESHNH